MSLITMKNFLESGIHFGHQTRHWNPKMKPYIYTERNGIHIINLQKTVMSAKSAYEAMRDIAAKGHQILFVGTKKQAQLEIERMAQKCDMPYINKRWLGGLLTNFNTVRQSVQRFKKLEEAFNNNTIHTLVKTKKEVLVLKREVKRMQKDLSGIREMVELPAALFVVDSSREEIAIREARRLSITIFALVDTNCDPDMVDYPIPANDDAIRAISLFLDIFARAILEGKKGVYSKPIIEEGESMDDQDDSSYSMPKIDTVKETEDKYGPDENYDTKEE